MTKTPQQKSKPRIHSQQVEVKLHQSCRDGFTRSDLEDIFSEVALAEFYAWMVGQTGSICNGKRYVYKMDDKGNYIRGGHYEATACSELPEGTVVDNDTILNGHGMVVYRWDVERFIEGGWKKAVFD